VEILELREFSFSVLENIVMVLNLFYCWVKASAIWISSTSTLQTNLCFIVAFRSGTTANWTSTNRDNCQKLLSQTKFFWGAII